LKPRNNGEQGLAVNLGQLRRLSRRGLITLGLEVTGLLSKIRMFRPSNRAGIIFTLHHVRPEQEGTAFKPNAHLEITPDYLRVVIKALIDEGFEFIRLSDLPEAMGRTDRSKPFAIFTLDDGYRNNRDYALPIFEEFNVPATIYVARGFAERTSIIWWEVLAELIDSQDEIAFDFGRGIELHKTQTLQEKICFFDLFCHSIWGQKEADAVELLEFLARQNGLDPLGTTQELTLSREELIELSKHPLIDLGAHGQRHLAIGKLSAADARQEIEGSADWLDTITGKKTSSFAFPYGSRSAATPRDFKIVQDLGIHLAVTTQPGMIHTDRIAQLSALPRVSLNGYYQQPRYAKALASGIPFRWGVR
jgi:peptidoglycan/xylan/chitin deacetylase (PgdA/CDA1 family)